MRNRIILSAVIAALLPAVGAAADLASLIRDANRKDALAAIRAGADVNKAQPDGTTPLMWAVNRRDTEQDLQIINLLLEKGANANARNSLGATVLTEALAANDPALIEQLLKAGADPNLGNDDEQTPLMLAARLGSLPIVESLVKAGAKVNAREKFRGQSALMWAVGTNSAGAGAVTDFLIQNGAEIEFRSATNDWGNQLTGEPRAQYRATGGLTPLLYATRSGCLACARSLVKAGASIEKPTPEGVSPLINAIDAGNYAVANFLLDEGANPHLSDWWGRTALYMAIDQHARSVRSGSGGGGGPGAGGRGGRGGGGPPGAGAGPAAAGAAGPAGGRGAGGGGFAAGGAGGSSLQVAQRLLEMGVDPNTQLNMHRPFLGRFVDDLMTTGCTPLLRAALGFDREAVELLLRHGAIVDLPNVMGVTPFMAAAGIGWGGVGASGPGQSPDVRRDNDEAGRQHNLQLESSAIAVLEVLLKAGADINARITDTSTHTALIARPSSMSERQGQTAIFGAVGAGTVTETHPPRNWLRVAQFLIDKGAKLDIKDAKGRTLIECMKGLQQGEQIAECGGRDSPSTPEMVALIRKAMGLPPEAAAASAPDASGAASQ